MYLSTNVPIYLSFSQCTYLYLSQWTYLSVSLSMYLCLFMSLSLCDSFSMCLYLNVSLSLCVSISMWLYLYLSFSLTFVRSVTRCSDNGCQKIERRCLLLLQCFNSRVETKLRWLRRPVAEGQNEKKNKKRVSASLSENLLRIQKVRIWGGCRSQWVFCIFKKMFYFHLCYFPTFTNSTNLQIINKW